MSQLPTSDLPGEGVSLRSGSSQNLEWSLRPWWRSVLFLAPVVLVSSWLAYQAIRVAWVAVQTDSVFVVDLQRALRWDPGNPDLVHRLGLIYSSNPSSIDPAESVKFLRQAVVLNPRRWDFWSDLATSCDFIGDTECADVAFARARDLSPMSPRLEWMTGNHYLLTDREEKAFPCFRRLLELTPEYSDAIFRVCLRATRNPQGIYSQVLPHGKDASARFDFLMFLGSSAEYEDAMRIWGQMISGPDHSPNLALVKPFLDFLIEQNQLQNAGTVWADLQHAGVIPTRSTSAVGNLIHDGRFQARPLGLGFDWHANDSPSLVYDFSDPSAYKGGTCLRIDFAVGQNENYTLLSQVVLVKPNTPYRLTSYLRSDGLTSDSGPRLRVDEMGCGNCEVRTSDETLGTTSWHPLGVLFVTHPLTQAVRVSLWRPPGKMPPRDISGKVWLDDVDLRPVDVPAPGAAQGRAR